MPTTFDDADGSYLGFDGALHTVADGHHHYTDLSLWDTYRTQTPLLTLVAPDVAHDVGISLLDDTDQNSGVIPKWVRGNRDYSIMGGDSGTPTLATLVTDGALTGADAQRAYDAIRAQATALPPRPGSPRADLGDYLDLGYIPFDHSDRGAAVTLEYAIDDASIAALAPTYGTADDVGLFTARAGSWRNLFDSEGSRFLRPRMSDGSWADPTAAGPVATYDPDFQDGYQEGTGWQYLWLVPQDVRGLDAALGDATMKQRLDEFFSSSLDEQAAPAVPVAQQHASAFGVYYAGNQYTPANETDLQAPWLYDWLGEPSKTQQVVHAEAQVFNATPYGLPGNDDAGTMSAAYVLSAIGLYQAQPGVDAWELSSPLFTSVVINGPGGPRFTIAAPGASSTNQYVATATLSGRSLDTTWLTTGDLHSDRTLAFTMSTTPTTWATAPAAAPPSLSDPASR
jgi:predicted alpha-1,2-mannosidase